jgi:hypothetical protein
MDQWVATTQLWTLRSEDQWGGDGYVAVPAPLAVGWTVQGHFASILTVVDAPLLPVTCTTRLVQTSISASVYADLLAATTEALTAELNIHTQLHPATLDTGFYLHAAYGVEMTRARQDVLLHAQMRSKNPIIFTDVTLAPSALAVELGTPSPVYGGVYEQVNAGTLFVSMYHWSAGTEVITTINTVGLSAGFDMAPTPAAVYIDSAARPPVVLPLSVVTPAARASVSVSALPEALCLTYATLKESVVVVGYGLQDDFQISLNLQPSTAWNDNAVSCSLAYTILVAHDAKVAFSSTFAASAMSVEITPIEPEDSGAHFYERALLTSPITTEITLNCPVNIREFVYA